MTFKGSVILSFCGIYSNGMTSEQSISGFLKRFWQCGLACAFLRKEAGLASFAADALEPETIANNAVAFHKWCGDLTSIGDAGWTVDSIYVLIESERGETGQTLICVPNVSERGQQVDVRGSRSLNQSDARNEVRGRRGELATMDL